MGILEYIPGMKSGSTVRNVVVGLVYLLFLPLVVFGLLFYLPYAVATNRNGLGETVSESPLGRLPGLDGAGWKAGGALFLYLILIIGVVGAVTPADTDSQSTAPTADGSTPTPEGDATPEPTATPTEVTVEDMDTARMVVDYDGNWEGHFGSKINEQDVNGQYKDLVLSVGADCCEDEHDIGYYDDGSRWVIDVPENSGRNVNIRAPVTATATPFGNGNLTLQLYIDGQLVAEDTSEGDEEARVEYRPEG